MLTIFLEFRFHDMVYLNSCLDLDLDPDFNLGKITFLDSPLQTSLSGLIHLS